MDSNVPLHFINDFQLPILIGVILITFAGLLVVGIMLSNNYLKNYANEKQLWQWLRPIGNAAIKPLLLIFLIYIIYIGYHLFIAAFDFAELNQTLEPIIDKLADVILVLSLFWFTIRIIDAFTSQLYLWSSSHDNKTGLVISSFINNSLKVIASLILINIIIPYLSIATDYLPIISKAATLLLITAMAWIIIQLINTSEQLILNRYNQGTDDLRSRKIFTQLTVLKKIIISLVILLAIASMLMTFNRVRELGATLLASAGLIAAIGTFAAQKTLSSMFAGLQIAITQPIRINDAVIVENEFGNVEEISLSYVVIKLWDLRRLVVPINYFIEKPFQNWTRNSRDLIGSVFLYVDYTLPIEEARRKFNDIIQNSSLWDKKVANLQVSDAKQNTMELRLLVSAADAGKLWDLRCQVREQMVNFIRENYPNCLPRMRVDAQTLVDLPSSPPHHS